MTERDLKSEEKELETLLNNGGMTPREADRLAEVRRALKKISSQRSWMARA